MSKMSIAGKGIVAVVIVFTVLQVLRPGIPARPATAELQAPPEIKHILEKDCYSCHSDQRRLSWFDQIVPGYWLVRRDILTARERLDFSTLGAKPAAVQKATLYEAVNMIQLGAMPLPQFVKLHSEAKVTPEELATLKAYLAPWAPVPNQSGKARGAVSTEAHEPVSVATVQPEFNGFPFDPDFKNWRLISTTNRGENRYPWSSCRWPLRDGRASIGDLRARDFLRTIQRRPLRRNVRIYCRALPRHNCRRLSASQLPGILCQGRMELTLNVPIPTACAEVRSPLSPGGSLITHGSP